MITAKIRRLSRRLYNSVIDLINSCNAMGDKNYNVVNPLKEEGHEISFYLFTYDSPKKEDIVKIYNPKKSTFLDPNYNKLGGGDLIETGIKIISITYINSLNQLLDEDLDLVISTRFDISFINLLVVPILISKTM